MDLNNFFKNRLNNWSAKDEAWAKPDAAVKANILQQIQTTTKPKSNNKKSLLIISLFIGLLTVGGTLGVVWQQYKVLKTKQIQQATELAEANKTIESLRITRATTTKLSPIIKMPEMMEINEKAETKASTISKEGATNIEFNRANNKAVSGLKNMITQPQIMFNLENQRRDLSTKSKDKNRIIANLELKNKAVTNPQKPDNYNMRQLNRKSFIVENTNQNNLKNQNQISGNDFSSINQVIKSRFQIGYEFGILETKTIQETKYEDFTKTSQKDEFNQHLTISNGLQFAYAINEKWWLQIGVRYGQSTWEEDLNFNSIYDKSGEYLQGNGHIGNSFTLKSSGTISDTESQISVEITNAADLKSGDLIISDLVSKAEISWLQIPLGIEYRFGENRLNYSLQSGINLNQIKSKSEITDGHIRSYNSELLINKIEYNDKNYTKQFLEGYLGVGIHYDITPSFAANANYNLRISPYLLKDLSLINRGLQIGINYSF
jgi:hypothetical protein